MEKKVDIFRKKRMMDLTVLLVVVIIFIGTSAIAQFSLLDGIKSFPESILWIVENLVPDKESISKLPKILDELMQTALLSVSVTVIAAIVAFGISLLGSNITNIHEVIKKVVRIIAAFFRNVPDVVWAMLLMFSFGQNILTGYFALFFTTVGLLTRAFIETIDEVSTDCVEALDTTGATFIQKVFQGILPSSITGIITWVLYMIETNIRSSTLIGVLTATGIGYIFDLYYKNLNFPSAGLVVLSIVVLVLVIEFISNKIRGIIA